MRLRKTAAATALAGAAVALIVLIPGSPSTPSSPRAAAAGADRFALAAALHARIGDARETCSTRSEAQFPGAFRDPRNLVVGPLVLVGGAYTDAATVREFGGNKFPLLVEAGHIVTVRLAAKGRRVAGLGYGPHPQGKTELRDTYQSVTFVACAAGKGNRRYSPQGPSGSYADAVNVTFWSGFVLTRVPSCIPLEVFVDGARSPLRVGLSLGRRCPSGST